MANHRNNHVENHEGAGMAAQGVGHGDTHTELEHAKASTKLFNETFDLSSASASANFKLGPDTGFAKAFDQNQTIELPNIWANSH
jgi:hypothetical protein